MSIHKYTHIYTKHRRENNLIVYILVTSIRNDFTNIVLCYLKTVFSHYETRSEIRPEGLLIINILINKVQFIFDTYQLFHSFYFSFHLNYSSRAIYVSSAPSLLRIAVIRKQGALRAGY